MRIRNRRTDGLTHGRGQCRGKEEKRHDQSLHTLRRTSVSQLVCRDIAKAVAQHAERDIGHLPPYRDRSHVSTACGLIAARRQLVDLPLYQAAEEARQNGEAEAKGDARDTAEFDVKLAQCRVDDMRENGHEYDDGQRVEVVQ